MYSVLIVEDELKVCQGLSVIVDWEALGFRIGGYCRDGLSAQQELMQASYDLVLCDIHIPGMNGLDLIHWMRTSNLTASVIIITAYAEFDYARRAINDGVVAYLLKPINEVLLEEALCRVKAMLDENPRTPPLAASGDVLTQAVMEIHNSYGKNLTADTLAKALYVSASKLNSLFRDKLNMTVKEYINDVRMERARFLLERSDKRIYEIAEEVGFRDIDYFTRIFKKSTGHTPGSYRNAHSKDKVAPARQNSTENEKQ